MDTLMKELRDHLIATLRRYDVAKSQYQKSNAVYRDAHLVGQPDAGRAATQRSQAIADCQWYAADVQTCASALSALCAYEGVRRG